MTTATKCPMCGEEKTREFRVQITIKSVDMVKQIFADELDVCADCAEEGRHTFAEIFADQRRIASARSSL